MTVRTRRSTCNRDCPDACGLVAEIDADGRIARLAGDPDHPVTRGFLCLRTSRAPRFFDGPQRLRQPLLRRGDRHVPIGLDEALDIAAERLGTIRAESGPAAIFHYRSGGSLGLLKHVADRFFEVLGPCTVKSGDICSGAGEAAQVADFGVSDSNDLFDLRNSRHVLLWGKNPTISNIHVVPVLKEARAKGARLTLIDPIRHQTANLVDDVIQPAPGGDLALALGVARRLLDSGRAPAAALDACENVDAFRALVAQRSAADWAVAAGVDDAVVAMLADRLAAGPTAILVGWGMQRRRHGAAIVRALDALSAISGNLFVPGGGCSFYFRRRGAFVAADPCTGAAARFVREPLFGADVLAASDPPIRAMWITAGNPVCMLPDAARVAAAIEATEFTVVVDPLFTETARRADLVLPVPTLLEDSDLVGAYGHHWIGESRPLVDPPPGVPHEVEIFAGLARRLGLGAEFDRGPDDWKRVFLRDAAADGVTLERLRDGAVRSPRAKPVLFGDGTVATPSGRVRLMTELPAGWELAAEPGELWLFSNSVREAQAAQWATAAPERLPITVHPDAAPPGLRDGDLVRVIGEAGELVGVLRLDPAQRPDVAVCPKGGSFDGGACANALIRARTTDEGLGAAFLDCRVRLAAP